MAVTLPVLKLDANLLRQLDRSGVQVRRPDHSKPTILAKINVTGWVGNRSMSRSSSAGSAQGSVGGVLSASRPAGFKEFLQDRLVALLIARLEARLRVSNDAAGVRDEGRSPVCVTLRKLGARAPENGIS